MPKLVIEDMPEQLYIEFNEDLQKKYNGNPWAKLQLLMANTKFYEMMSQVLCEGMVPVYEESQDVSPKQEEKEESCIQTFGGNIE